ncbi:6-phosphogluconolactonase [Polaribacter sp.]|nr:6-phosphogluconolactonase [Polaribacter sp.]
MKNSNVHITDTDSFNDFSANFIKNRIEKITTDRKINIALSGGSTPLPILKKLKQFDLKWNLINFFLVDERVVSLESSESNYKNIRDVFFDFLPSQNFPILKESNPIDKVVALYQKSISQHVPLDANNIPKFDLIILGMGNDGHTASLFPDTKALDEKKAFVIKNYVPKFESYRITLTYPVLLNSEQSIVLLKGEDKLKIYKEIMDGVGEKYPITKLLGPNLNWIIGK